MYSKNRELYSKPHCYQYEIRQQNLQSDLERIKLPLPILSGLRVSDFEFEYVPKEDRKRCREVREFIEKHEWLGKMPHRPTHRFIATYRGHIAGAIVMATPNSFSVAMFSRRYRDLEKLISRGACISWSPKNLGSSLVMFSIRWMVNNTPFRFFSAYSDTEAKELGTIYQSCNLIYLGQRYGARYEYFDQKNPDKGWFSDRLFRKTSQVKKYASELEIGWSSLWLKKDRVIWRLIPTDIKYQLRQLAKDHQARCQKRKLPFKHKYLYILGQNKTETHFFRSHFFKLNPEFSPKENNNRLTGLAYPKIRIVENTDQ